MVRQCAEKFRYDRGDINRMRDYARKVWIEVRSEISPVFSLLPPKGLERPDINKLTSGDPTKRMLVIRLVAHIFGVESDREMQKHLTEARTKYPADDAFWTRHGIEILHG